MCSDSTIPFRSSLARLDFFFRDVLTPVTEPFLIVSYALLISFTSKMANTLLYRLGTVPRVGSTTIWTFSGSTSMLGRADPDVIGHDLDLITVRDLTAA